MQKVTPSCISFVFVHLKLMTTSILKMQLPSLGFSLMSCRERCKGFVLMYMLCSLSASFLSLQQVFDGMTEGIRQTLPLWVVYVFAAQLIQSLIYVFT